MPIIPVLRAVLAKDRSAMKPDEERRKEPRHPCTWPVEFWHPGLRRTITAVGRDRSNGGACVRLPLTVPIVAGQKLELRFLPQIDPRRRSPRPIEASRMARVCRVSRLQTVLEAEQIVGLEML